jgi:phage tail sheath protein FI
MPPKKIPGVFVQESTATIPPIAGVNTSVTAFVGPTLKGPTQSRPKLLTSFADFERIYGGLGDLGFDPRLNHVAHGVRVFFAEGGMRLYVARVKGKSKKVAPTPADYGKAFALLAALPEISIVAAPGHTAFPAALAADIAAKLVAHAEQLRYRIAVLDTPAGQNVAAAQAYKGNFNSKFAALYFPWVVVTNPAFKPALPGSSPELILPPSGFLCGIYARNDATRGVFKAPADLMVQTALRFERPITAAEQGILNPAGINCLRTFAGAGNAVWGARTTSADPEWRYVPVTRYFAYLERSIDVGTQWAVFEPNAEPLWVRVRDLITNFLMIEWRNGAIPGIKPEQAFFVKCDRSTMTQNDLDNGRLICLVGVAALRPAEFIIFRIGQKTAAATS